MNKNKIVTGGVGVVAALSSIIGWKVYFSGGDVSGLCWPFWWIGIFTWDDGMVLGTFLFIACLILFFKNRAIVSGIFFSSYVLFRSFIEVLYNLNAQFSSTSRPWEEYLPNLAASLHLRVVELFVIAQISYTVICIISFVALLVYLKKYFKEA